MRFGAQPEVEGEVRSQLEVVLSKERRVLRAHVVFRLSGGIPCLHISQQEVGIANLDGGVAGGELAGKAYGRPIDGAPRCRVIFLHQQLTTKVQNILAFYPSERIRGSVGVLDEKCFRARSQIRRRTGSPYADRGKDIRGRELQSNLGRNTLAKGLLSVVIRLTVPGKTEFVDHGIADCVHV